MKQKNLYKIKDAPVVASRLGNIKATTFIFLSPASQINWWTKSHWRR